MTIDPMRLLPCADAADADRAAMTAALARTGPAPFAYDGRALTIDAFESHVHSYDFGSVLPSLIVFHHTANPAASWAPAPGVPNWDAGEDGMPPAAIQAKRTHQLDGIRNYYRDSLKWHAGPHLFIDDRFVHLFTPMYNVGVHAAEGNSWHAADGTFRYSLGIEVVGHYIAAVWPPAIQRIIARAIGALQRRLQTFELTYTDAPRHRPDLHDGSIAFHHDFNKPECPGDAITPDFAIGVLTTRAFFAPGHYTARGVAIHEAPDLQSRVALGGTAFLESGAPADIDEVKPGGWGHLRDGRGFVLMEQLKRLS